MCAWIQAAFFELFPFPDKRSPESFRDETIKDPLYTSIYERLEKATEGAKVETQKLFGDYAKQYVSDQQDMTASIISRAQALLVSQTLLGALLALVTALMGHTEVVDGWKVYGLVVLLVYTIVQVLLLTFNALRATAGLSVSYPGVSPLINWIPEGEVLLEKNMGLALIKTYWDLNISNSWRVSHYSLAQRCLRNIIVALAALIFALLFAVLYARTNGPSAIPPYELIHSTGS
ncbi:MAG TPA: hypothetical protein VH206_09580 [Xanthobacteraceae bacterium]|jgi:hypothetical protein|nr:hypothetical protein [Xanthobacteraceae bacterium]